MIGYIITASVFTCFGFLIGAVISHAKVNYLCERLSLAEQELRDQATVVKELTQALRDMLGTVEGQPRQAAVTLDTAMVHGALASCDRLVTEQNARPVSAT